MSDIDEARRRARALVAKAARRSREDWEIDIAAALRQVAVEAAEIASKAASYRPRPGYLPTLEERDVAERAIRARFGIEEPSQ